MKQLLVLFRYRKEIWAMLWYSLREVQYYGHLTPTERKILSPMSFQELRITSRGSQKHLAWWELIPTEDKVFFVKYVLGMYLKGEDELKSELTNSHIERIFKAREELKQFM